MFQKLHKFIGKNIRHLVERTDEDYVLRMHSNRIYYVRESLMRRATNVSQPSQTSGKVILLSSRRDRPCKTVYCCRSLGRSWCTLEHV